jgi:hypothetical protein
MECLAVDWSGAVSGAASRIWVARAQQGRLTSLDAPGSREAVHELLMQRRRGPPCLVGLDFAFAFPAWFAAEQQWPDIAAQWITVRDHGERWLRECAPPFWGRRGKPRPHDAHRGLRETERRWPSAHQPKSVFQIGGAGSVGTGSLRGMPMLLLLRQAGWAVWPFDRPGTHTLVEIYPRLFTGPVVKRSAEARLAVLRAPGRVIPARVQTVMHQSEDAFDAAMSALQMSRTGSATRWPDHSPLSAVEGEIWRPADASLLR